MLNEMSLTMLKIFQTFEEKISFNHIQSILLFEQNVDWKEKV